MPRATVRIRVPFVDVDSSERIHFTAVMRYWEIAEHALMRSLELPYATTLREVAFPRAHVSADFRGAIVFDDLLDVEARVERVGRTSWTVAFSARHAAPEGVQGNAEGAGAEPGAVEATEVARPILAEGRMTIVAMDPATQRAAPLPDALRRALEGE